MQNPDRYFEPADAGRAALRTAVADVDRFIATLPRGNPGADQGLLAAWATLVQLMALPEPPQLRDCPHCGHVGMRAATRCGHCWALLAEVPVTAAVNQTAGGLAES